MGVGLTSHLMERGSLGVVWRVVAALRLMFDHAGLRLGSTVRGTTGVFPTVLLRKV